MNMGYVYLFFAIIFEVTGTLMLPISKTFTKPFPSIVIIGLYIFGEEVFGSLYRPQMELGIYLIISAFAMTIIRWVVTGKHFWNKP